MIAECRSSGMTVKSWCKANGICEQSYYRNLQIKVNKDMDKRKIGKWIFGFIVAVGLIFIFKKCTLCNIWNHIVEWNIKISREKIVCLFGIYLIEIFMFLILEDSLVLKFFGDASLFLDNKSKYLLQKEEVGLAIYCIRIKYGISKLMYLLGAGWSKPSFLFKDKIVWNSIKRPTIKEFFLEVTFSLVKLPALIAICLTGISLNWFGINDIQNGMKTLYSYRLNFWNAVQNVSPLTTVALLASIWYFISFEGNIKRAVARANYRKMEEIIEKQRKLTEIIEKVLYLASENLQYVIKCQELIIDLAIYRKFFDYKDYKSMSRTALNVENYCFQDIPELVDVVEMLKELNSSGNRGALLVFSSYKYEFLTLMGQSYFLSLEKLNKIFFTKESIAVLFNEDESRKSKYSEQEICKIREDYSNGLQDVIIEGLELLYIFYRYYNKMNKLLNFRTDKVGRTLRMFTGKE